MPLKKCNNSRSKARTTQQISTTHTPSNIRHPSMCEAERIRHIMKAHIGHVENHVLFIGYCAEHTLVAQILSGQNPLNIFGEPHRVRARVASLDAFSGHADKHELRRYVDALTGDIKKVFVVHGEESQAMAFAETLRAMKPKAEVFVPEYKQSATI